MGDVSARLRVRIIFSRVRDDASGTGRQAAVSRPDAPGRTRLTPQRRAVLDAIEADRTGRFTALDLFERARRSSPRLGLATIYRTLDLLRQTGLTACALGRGAPGLCPLQPRAPPSPRLPELRLGRGHRAVLHCRASEILSGATASAPSRTSSRSTGPAGAVHELDRNPTRGAHRGLDTRRRGWSRSSSTASCTTLIALTGGVVVGVALFDVMPEAFEAVGDSARVACPHRRRLPRLLPRRAGPRPPPPRRAGTGPRPCPGR